MSDKSSIALLPVLSSQKSVYNFKELSQQCSEFLKQAAKTIVDSQSFTEENIKTILMDSIQSIYGKKEKTKRPKQAKTAYIYFCTDKRPELKDQFPDEDGKGITKKLAEAWRSLDDDEKEPYIEMWKQEKEKLQSEKESSESESDSDAPPKKESKVKSKKDAKIKKEVSSDSETEGKKKKKDKSASESDSETNIKIVSGFSESEVKACVSKKTVKELKTFCKHYGEDSLPDNFEKLQKADLTSLCKTLMEKNNIKSWTL